ncbi:MAG: hypothetical protein LRZ85_08255 [Alphaproteobacteria bacterium]|nr:hypothetical protein [Alphaproteobacteria bacterium]MCD8570056.1 hypothetical protein [Alphaproteobacteria bacterium]
MTEHKEVMLYGMFSAHADLNPQNDGAKTPPFSTDTNDSNTNESEQPQDFRLELPWAARVL